MNAFKKAVKKSKAFFLGLVAMLMVGNAAYGEPVQPGEEQAIVYENDVVATIDAQLQGIDLDAIRSKAPLIMEKSMEDIQAAIAKGDLSYAELTAFYLDRIKRFDKAAGGINSVVTINPQAMAAAKALDEHTGADKNPLYGIPVLLKDNINTNDMPTSGGTLALKDFVPADNAPVVSKLLAAKAILLGKANLSELANFVDLRMPNGYSSSLGQTHNPFAPLMMSPLGSSAGSAAAVAANLCAVSLGTETTGSIIAPAYIHSLVGFKPTKGHISTEGVLPLSSTMDTVGPITKSVKDAVALYNASLADTQHQATLNAGFSLKGKRIGVYKGDGSKALVDTLKKLGAEPVELHWDEMRFGNDFIIIHDFAADFAAYAKKHNAPVKTIEELIAYNQQDMARRAKYGQDLVVEASKAKNTSQEQSLKEVADVQAYVQQLIKEKNLDAFVFMTDLACIVPCTAGYPEITVPFGKNEFDEPIGATFFGMANEDEKLLNIAYAFEQGTNMRLAPTAYMEAVEK